MLWSANGEDRVMLKIILGAIIGGGIGFAIGYFGKCASGMCPLTSNPYIAAIIGIIIGVLVTVSK